MVHPALFAVLGGLGWLYWRRRDGNSADEEIEPMDDDSGLFAPECYALMDARGWPYYWNRGDPGTPWEDGPEGVDCSGFAQMALVKLGIMSDEEPDRSSAGLADVCDPVELGDQVPGDLAYYPGHVMVVISDPLASQGGHSAVMGASGGERGTLGDNPKAYVKVFSTADYRDDFVTYMRWPGDSEDG